MQCGCTDVALYIIANTGQDVHFYVNNSQDQDKRFILELNSSAKFAQRAVKLLKTSRITTQSVEKWRNQNEQKCRQKWPQNKMNSFTIKLYHDLK